MITLGGAATKIHLAAGATDLRRGHAGLYTLIEHHFGAEPMSGHLWVFINRRRDMIKVFWWEEGGMCLLGKRLHKGTFKTWPRDDEKTVLLTAAQLQMLLSGIDLAALRSRRWVRRREPAHEPLPQ